MRSTCEFLWAPQERRESGPQLDSACSGHLRENQDRPRIISSVTQSIPRGAQSLFSRAPPVYVVSSFSGRLFPEIKVIKYFFLQVEISIFALSKQTDMTSQKKYTIKTTRSGRNETRESITEGTLDELIKYFGYTLEIGNSWNKKINRYPKTIKSFVSNLQKAYEEKEASCFSRTFVELITK